VLVAQEGPRQTRRELVRDLLQVEAPARAGRELDLEVVAVEVVVALERFDDQEVDREPHRAAPVRVAAEQAGVRLGGRVLDRVLAAGELDAIGLRLVDARQRAQPKGDRNSFSSST
jgi:hypothetical protein